MMYKRPLWFVLSATFILMLIMLFLFTDVQLVAFNRNYYEQQYERYKIPQSIGISSPELMEATDNLLNYIDGKREDLNFTETINGVQQEFFSERDKLHMIDVKSLFVKGKIIRNIALLYCILFGALFVYKAKNKSKNFSKLLIYTFFAGIVPIILLIILMNIDFYKYFTLFHEIFFNNDLWLLEPAKDRLINMYPEAFFSDTAFRIVFYYIGELTMLLVLGVIGLVSKRRSLASK